MAIPAPIIRLDEAVINRIAAGEIIQRPSNALKELIENSIDAKSTNIQVTVQNGGLKMLQIEDNGCGIRKEDFGIVCERFTTSKLRDFEDLSTIGTYGFRGEALASISHVAHLTIVSKTADQKCAYKATYIDSKIKEPVVAIAGLQGTRICVEDLFYNMSVRKNTLRNASEEYQKISDVVSKYAIHNASIGFGLKKYGESNDTRTPQNSTEIENIRTIYGHQIAKELVDVSVTSDEYKFSAKGYITNVNYAAKKMQTLLFINHRLVDCQSIRKSIDQIYATYLPKNMHPFIYLSLDIVPENIDVNVHPTKHEVHFLNEEQIVEIIAKTIEDKLLGSNNARIFYTQSKLPVVTTIIANDSKNGIEDGNTTMKSIYPKDFVRTDSQSQKIDKFFGAPVMKKSKPNNPDPNLSLTDLDDEDASADKKRQEAMELDQSFMKRVDRFEDNLLNSTVVSENRAENVENSAVVDRMLESVATRDKSVNGDARKTVDSSAKSPVKKKKTSFEKVRVESHLLSVHQLRRDIEACCDWQLRSVFHRHVFVGCADAGHALIQHDTRLYLCDTQRLFTEMLYATIIYDFQNLHVFEFSDPLPLDELTIMALQLPESGWTPADGPPEQLATRVAEIIASKTDMLQDYFSVGVNRDDSGTIMLTSLPVIVENHIPDFGHLPLYILRLATEVDWEDEQQCFHTFARETAAFYAHVPTDRGEADADYNWQWHVEHVIYGGALKEFLMPPKSIRSSGAVLQVADLPQLYKVFERC